MLLLTTLIAIGVTLAYFVDVVDTKSYLVTGTVKVITTNSTPNICNWTTGDKVKLYYEVIQSGNKSTVSRYRYELAWDQIYSDSLSNWVDLNGKTIGDLNEALKIGVYTDEACTQGYKVPIQAMSGTQQFLGATGNGGKKIITKQNGYATGWVYTPLTAGVGVGAEQEGQIQNEPLKLTLWLKFYDDAGNEYQGQRFVLVLVYETVQARNNVWTRPSPSLTDSAVEEYWENMADAYDPSDSANNTQYFENANVDKTYFVATTS